MTLVRLVVASIIAAAACPVFAQSETYLLALPFGSPSGPTTENCARVAQTRGGFCRSMNLPDPGGTGTSPIEIYFHIGDLNNIYEHNQADFVPWPWSDTARILENSDFSNRRIIPVSSNPCLIMKCDEGTVCVWNKSAPMANAQCHAEPGYSYEAPPIGDFAPLGSIQSLRLMQSANDALKAPEPPDLAMCGELPPGKTCMGNYIKDAEGNIWMVP